jgi:CheY-like chemotaxis protein
MDEATAAHSFDVLVLDWQMGPPDGLALLDLLREVHGAKSTPAVLATVELSPTSGCCALKPVTGVAISWPNAWQELARPGLPRGRCKLTTARRRGLSGAVDRATRRPILAPQR